MAIEHTDGATIITGDDTRLYRCMALIAALKLEITTGMRHSAGSVMLAAKQRCGSARGTKRNVLQDLVTYTMAQFPSYRPNIAVIRAMDRKYLKRTASEMVWLRAVFMSAGPRPGDEIGATAMYPAKVVRELRELGAITIDAAGIERVGIVTDETIALARGE